MQKNTFDFTDHMNEHLPWCIIINQQTCSERKWILWKTCLEKHNIFFTVHKSYTISNFSYILSQLISSGNKYFLFAGGDGTLHHGGNLLIEHAGNKTSDIIIGLLPCGTGIRIILCLPISMVTLRLVTGGVVFTTKS